eukprot:Gb_09460 [translate_table: standard]
MTLIFYLTYVRNCVYLWLLAFVFMLPESKKLGDFEIEELSQGACLLVPLRLGPQEDDNNSIPRNFAKQENTGINLDAYKDILVDTSGDNVPSLVNTFAEIDLGDALNQSIRRCKYVKPTLVQRYAIPILLARRDITACAQTNSGKTTAFCFNEEFCQTMSSVRGSGHLSKAFIIFQRHVSNSGGMAFWKLEAKAGTEGGYHVENPNQKKLGSSGADQRVNLKGKRMKEKGIEVLQKERLAIKGWRVWQKDMEGKQRVEDKQPMLVFLESRLNIKVSRRKTKKLSKSSEQGDDHRVLPSATDMHEVFGEFDEKEQPEYVAQHSLEQSPHRQASEEEGSEHRGPRPKDIVPNMNQMKNNNLIKGKRRNQ